MKTRINLMIICLLMTSVIKGQEILTEAGFNPEAIKPEITEQLMILNGQFKDQTIEIWDTDSLRSPNIGSIHEGCPEIGCEKLHEGNVKYNESEYEGKMKSENIDYILLVVILPA